MREIKFRAWDKEEGKMIVRSPYQSFCEFLMTPSGSVYEKGYLKPFILLQYTGLKDKTGAEIYEGHILKIFDKNYEVKIINTGSRVFVDYGYPDEHNGPAPSWVEIIGNIYENGDLLNGKQ